MRQVKGSRSIGPGRAIATLAALLAVGGSAAVEGDERSTAVRIHLSRSKGGADDVTESLDDVRRAVHDGKSAPTLLEVPAAEPVDFELVVTHRFATRGASANDLKPAAFTYQVYALAIVGSETAEKLAGSGVIWRQAAIDLARQTDAYARAQRHRFLRARADWRDPGFDFEPLTKPLAKQWGTKGGEAVVTAVRPDGPAARAGLQVGDALLALADHKIEAAGDLAGAIYAAPAGAALQLGVAQKGARRTITLTLP